MNSRVLFVFGYVLLLASLGLGFFVFGFIPKNVFSFRGEVLPTSVLMLDAVPTILFLAGVGLLVAAQLKQRSESLEET